MKIVIVVPAWNEEKNIKTSIEDLLQNGYDNIVVVDDHSKDQTAEVVKNLNVVLLRHSANRGQGASLQTGHDYALLNGAEIVIDFDSDGQMQAKDIAKMIQPILDDQAEIVFGSRFLDNQTQIPWLKKNLIHRPARVLNNFLTGIKLSDVHCGFRALSRTALEKLKLTQDKMAHATEFVVLTKQLGLRHAEMPVEIVYKNFGQGFGGGIKVLKELFIDKLLK